jgi:predicted transposase/invertase (TIGR01784 family)
MPEVNYPHDRGYKSLLASEEIFLELLQSFVDMGWVSQIDSEAITRIDKSYILQDFSEKEADLVYRLKIKDQEVIFYLLMELQSSVDYQMPYRLLLYMVEIWRDLLKNISSEEAAKKDFRLPAIIPMVLYNGRDKWTACRSFRETLAEAELFKEYVVDFEYILIDVNRYEKRALMDLANLIGAVFLLDQEIDSKEYRNRLLGIAPILRKFDANSFQLFKSWLKIISSADLPEHTKQEIIRIIDESTPEEAERMVTNMEKTLGNIYEEGKNDGFLAGKIEAAQKMLIENISEDLIVKITGLPVEQIRKIKLELN